MLKVPGSALRSTKHNCRSQINEERDTPRPEAFCCLVVENNNLAWR